MKNAFLLIVMIIAVWAYYPGLGGSFTFDDNYNIYDNDLIKIEHFSFEDLWQASLSSDSGRLKRPVAMFSFAVNYLLTGMDPWWMKLTNLVIHLINGLLVLLVIRYLFHRFHDRNRTTLTLVPYLISGIWLAHPVNVTAVSYIVQRMASLSATFVLLAILCYLKIREGRLIGWKGYILSLSILIFWLLGLLSKENAILLSIYIFVIEWCVYSFQTESKREKIHIGILWVSLLAPWFCAFFYTIYNPSFILSGYDLRQFTPLERLFTEFRIVIDYLRLILIPDIRHMGLYHDDIVLSKSLFDPISTFLSILMIIGLLVLAIRMRSKSPLFCLGIFWFFGGHLLESTVFPLELMFLHRNYLPSIGILLLTAEVVVRLHHKYRVLMAVVAMSILLGFSFCTRSLAYQWSGDFRMSILQAINHPDSIRANFNAGQVIKAYAIFSLDGKQKDDNKRMAIEYFNKIRKLDPDDITGELSILETYLQIEEVPPRSLIESLIRELPYSKIDAGVADIFKTYLRCLKVERCFLNPEDFERLINASIESENRGNVSKSDLHMLYAEYLADDKQDIKAAIANAVHAVVATTSLKNIAMLARYYEKGGYQNLMRRTINLLDELDKFGQYRKFIRESNEKLNVQSHAQ